MPIDALFDTGIFDDSLFDTSLYIPPLPVPTTYTGADARITIWQRLSTGDTNALSQSAMGISDIDLAISREIVEQSLIGEEGNLFVPGSISMDGSFTACKLDKDFAGTLLGAVVSGNYFVVSGTVGSKSLSFYLISCLCNGFDLVMGDSETISEGSIDFLIADPSNVKVRTPTKSRGTYISDVN
jgi:hypothetical protein